jgi:hypothetical protein
LSNYASAKAASEVAGGHYRIGVTITPLDPDSKEPTNLTLRGPGSNVLAVTDGEAWPYDSSDVKFWFEPLVESFGDITCAAEIHSAFQTLADPRLVLRNVRINGILDNGQLTFASGSPAESPSPTGDEVRLSQLLQYQVWTGAAVEYAIYYFASEDTGDTTAYKKQTIFTGIVKSVDGLDSERITLGLAQDSKAEDTLIPHRKITDPADPNVRGQYIPLVFGNAYDAALTNHVNGLPIETAIIAGYKPPLAPVLSWRRATGAGDKGYWLITNDCTGVNSEWTWQTEFPSGGKSNDDDRLLVYFPEADAWGIVLETGTPGSSTVYSMVSELLDGSPDIEVGVDEYQLIDLYIPCNGIHTDTHSMLDEPRYLFDRNPYKVAYLNVDNTTLAWSIRFTISPISLMGEVPLIENCIGAYLILGETTFTGSPEIDYGIAAISCNNWIGHSIGDPEGHLGTADIEAGGLRRQREDNVDPIAVSAYIQPSKAQQPIMGLNWNYIHDGSTDPGEAVVEIQVTQAGAAGDEIPIIDVGVVCRVKLKTGGVALTRTSPMVDITGRIVRR